MAELLDHQLRFLAHLYTLRQANVPAEDRHPGMSLMESGEGFDHCIAQVVGLASPVFG
jgi:hypothetical protein